MPLIVTKVTEGLYRGARPSAADFRNLQSVYNIVTCLDLEGPRFSTEEETWCSQLGIASLLIPMSTIARPELEKVHMAMSFIQAARRPIYVHCHQGVDRTGIVCAAYRVWVQDWPVQDAWAEMMQMGFHKWRYLFWLPRIREILSA